MRNLTVATTPHPAFPAQFSTDEIEPERFRWTTDEYYRAAELGVFEGRHVELIDGDIMLKTDHDRLTDYNGEGEPPRFQWTSDQYNLLGEAGVFDGKRVELVEGEIIEMAPMGPRHFVAINLVAEVLTSVFGKGFFVSSQNQLDVDKRSQPEPDIAVLKGSPRDYVGGHPKTLVLAVEVADSSIQRDRIYKTKLYAKAGIEDYWIVNLADNCLEVYRKPVNDVELGFVYLEKSVLGEDESISPLAIPDAAISVADILP
jgi:Uma2 family endonuclease